MDTLLERSMQSHDGINWISKVEELGRLLEEQQDYSEKHRATHPKAMDALFAYGLGKLSIPKAFGGHQLPLSIIVEILQSLAKYDASVSWQVAVQVAMGRLADYVSEETARKVYCGTNRFVIGAIHAGGKAVPEKGGYVLNGQWAFASGSYYADWLVCTATVDPLSPGRDREVRMFFVPANECEIVDTWDSLGLRGTCSNDFRCTDVWVDSLFSVDASALKYRPKQRSTLGYQTGYYDFGTIAAMGTIFGIAKAAVEYFQRNRKTPMDPATKAVIDEKVGRSVSNVYSGQLLLDAAISQSMVRDDGLTEGTHPRVAAAAATMTENAVNAVNQIYSVAGASGVYKRNFLERCFRDIHTGSKHFTISPLNFHGIGRAYLDSAGQ